MISLLVARPIWPKTLIQFVYGVIHCSTMTTLFDDLNHGSNGVRSLRMGAPGDIVLLQSAELVKNATQKLMVSTGYI